MYCFDSGSFHRHSGSNKSRLVDALTDVLVRSRSVLENHFTYIVPKPPKRSPKKAENIEKDDDDDGETTEETGTSPSAGSPGGDTDGSVGSARDFHIKNRRSKFEGYVNMTHFPSIDDRYNFTPLP